ncbi:MAG: aldo/keto reductase [Gammaproteobacteria bacterium]|nr:aldo/keto reductase [Gammaproteobacteria bacterium]
MASNPVAAAAAAGTLTLAAGLTINRMGYGAMRLTGPGIWGEPSDPAAAGAVLRRALELGVNFIDTANSYGPEVNECLIAEVLHPYPTGLVIATKGGLTRPGPGRWEPDGRPEQLRAACEGSLRRLRLDCIDLYQLHTPDRGRVPLEDSLGALVRLQGEGKIRHIGVSNVDLLELRRAQALATVVSVQNRYNLEDRSSEDVLEYCQQQGLAFIPWFPLEAGRHATAHGQNGAGAVLGEIAKAHGATTAQVALAWLLAHSPVMLPIPGTSSIAHLEENVAAAPIALNIDELARMDDGWAR